MSSKIDEKTFNKLPESLQIAQKAIETEEVQEIIKKLAKYNLAVAMPHMHTEGSFVELPLDQMQVERKLVTSFVPANEVDPSSMIPVVWRWVNGVAVSASSCHYCDGDGD